MGSNFPKGSSFTSKALLILRRRRRLRRTSPSVVEKTTSPDRLKASDSKSGVRFREFFTDWDESTNIGNAADLRDPDFDMKNGFLSPSTPSSSILRQCSQNESDEALGGATYDSPYYSFLLEDHQQNNINSFLGHIDGFGGNEYASDVEASLLKPSPVRNLRDIDDENETKAPQAV